MRTLVNTVNNLDGPFAQVNQTPFSNTAYVLYVFICAYMY